MTDHYRHNNSLLEKTRLNLSLFDLHSHIDPELRGAAVVLTISAHSSTGEACLLLTLRSSSLRKHAGQFALPGGKIDAGESVEQAALRELSEELGLDLKEQDILGRLDDYPTRSGFVISPVVVWNSTSSALLPNPDEVARVYEIPLTQLATSDFATISYNDTSRQHIQNQADTVTENREHPFLSISPAALNTTVYSPTAAIIYQFREVALFGNATRVAHFEQPAFAWK